MVIVKIRKPILIPIGGWLAQGEEVGLPQAAADALVVNRYAEYVVPEAPAVRWSHSKLARAKDEPPVDAGAGDEK